VTPAQLRTRIAINDARGDVLRAMLALAECPANRPDLAERFERVLAGHRVRLAGMIERLSQGADVPKDQR